MRREKYRAEEFDQLQQCIADGVDTATYPALLVFDFDGVLSTSEENDIYKMTPEPSEGKELTKLAGAWNLNLEGYDVPYQRHLLFQAAAAQLKRRIEPGMACSLAQDACRKGCKIYVLSARSGVYAIRRMHEFLDEHEIRPIEVFHVGRVSKEKQLALLLEKFPAQHVVYLEDESRHIDAIEVAFKANPNNDRLHLFEVEHDANLLNSSLRTTAWSVLRGGCENKLEEGHMNLDEIRKIGLEHGRQLFIYHAGQRVQSIGHYFAALAFLTAAAVTLLTSSSHFAHQQAAGIVLCLVALTITLLLWGIDRRNAQLVKLDENLLKPLEREYGSRLFPAFSHQRTAQREGNHFAIMDNAEKSYSRLGSKRNGEDDPGDFLQYKKLVPLIFGVFILIWLGLLWLFAVLNFEKVEPLNVKVSGSLQGHQTEIGQKTAESNAFKEAPQPRIEQPPHLPKSKPKDERGRR